MTVREIVYPEVNDLERVLSYLRESLPAEELQSFLVQARPLTQSLGRYDSSALEPFYGLIGTTLYHQLRRDNRAPVEAYLVFGDCYALVDAPVEEKMSLVEKGMREYRNHWEVKEEISKTFNE